MKGIQSCRGVEAVTKAFKNVRHRQDVIIEVCIVELAARGDTQSCHDVFQLLQVLRLDGLLA